VKRGLWITPLLLAVAGALWGLDGVWSAAYGIALILVNFLLAAALVATSARISLAMMMAATLFGYLIRLGLISIAVYVVKDQSWVSLPALGITINRHASWVALLGNEICRSVACISWIEAKCARMSTCPAPRD